MPCSTPLYFPDAIALSAAAASAIARSSVSAATQFNCPLYRFNRARYIVVSSTDVTCRVSSSRARWVTGQYAASSRFCGRRTRGGASILKVATGAGDGAMPGGFGLK